MSSRSRRDGAEPSTASAPASPRIGLASPLVVPPRMVPRAQQLTNAKFIAQAASSGGGGADVGLAARDQCGRDELRKLQNRQLFRVVAQCCWAVENLGTLSFGLAEKVRGVKILAIKGRVFAHHYRIKIFQGGLV